MNLIASFNVANGQSPNGLTPVGDGSFYGTTHLGGTNSRGVIFRATTNGVLTVLAFFGGSAGVQPYDSLTRGTNGNFYGTTYTGGNGAGGTVFVLSFPLILPPPVLSGGNLNFPFQTIAGQSYAFQVATNLASGWTVYTNIVGNGSVFQFSVPISNGPARYVRIHEP